MLLKEIACSENHTKYINPALCEQNVEFVEVKACDVHTTGTIMLQMIYIILFVVILSEKSLLMKFPSWIQKKSNASITEIFHSPSRCYFGKPLQTCFVLLGNVVLMEAF